MRSRKSVWLLIFRYMYRAILERPLWWFLAKVKTFFFAELDVQLQAFEQRSATQDADARRRWESIEAWLKKEDSSSHATQQRLQALEQHFQRVGDTLRSVEQRLSSVEHQFQDLESSNVRYWDAQERLLLSLFRQSEPEPQDTLPAASASERFDLNSRLPGVHAANGLR